MVLPGSPGGRVRRCRLYSSGPSEFVGRAIFYSSKECAQGLVSIQPID